MLLDLELGWECLVLLTFLIVFILPFVPNHKVRYYGCYAFYVFYVSFFGTLLVPLFLIQGVKNVLNLRLAGSILKHVTKFIGVKWELRGGEILSVERGAVIAANHQSILDILGMFNIWEVMGKCTVVAKKELIYVPPFGPVAWLAGLVYIDRGNVKLAYEKLMRATALILNNKTKLWLFPEGTRNKGGEKLLPFRRGAFRMAIECQVPVIPVVFSPYYFLDQENKTFHQGKMIISVLDPISTHGLTANDVETLKEKTYDVMAAEYARLREEVTKSPVKSKTS